MTNWTFIHIADIQVGSPRSFRFAPAWNDNWETAKRQILEINPDLLLVGGDLARDGNVHRYELEAIKADFDGLPFPVFVVPGNMDTGNKHTRVPGFSEKRDDLGLNLQPAQLRQFEEVFGPSQWSFVHKGVRFSGFCDMLVNSGLPEEEALWQWMEAQTRLPRARFHIWMMHYALFIEDLHEPNFDIGDSAQYLDWYFGTDNPGRTRLLETFKATAATRVITGHIHCRRHVEAEGIQFDLAPATCFSQFDDRWPDGDPTLGFLRYDVSEENIACAFVPLERLSTAEGYGPGGHPKPETWDYSLAWEK